MQSLWQPQRRQMVLIVRPFPLMRPLLATYIASTCHIDQPILAQLPPSSLSHFRHLTTQWLWRSYVIWSTGFCDSVGELRSCRSPPQNRNHAGLVSLSQCSKSQALCLIAIIALLNGFASSARFTLCNRCLLRLVSSSAIHP